jgi:hypothetical protein
MGNTELMNVYGLGRLASRSPGCRVKSIVHIWFGHVGSTNGTRGFGAKSLAVPPHGQAFLPVEPIPTLMIRHRLHRPVLLLPLRYPSTDQWNLGCS